MDSVWSYSFVIPFHDSLHAKYNRPNNNVTKRNLFKKVMGRHFHAYISLFIREQTMVRMIWYTSLRATAWFIICDIISRHVVFCIAASLTPASIITISGFRICNSLDGSSSRFFVIFPPGMCAYQMDSYHEWSTFNCWATEVGKVTLLLGLLFLAWRESWKGATKE